MKMISVILCCVIEKLTYFPMYEAVLNSHLFTQIHRLHLYFNPIFHYDSMYVKFIVELAMILSNGY